MLKSLRYCKPTAVFLLLLLPFQAMALRIITLSPHLTELVYAAGLAEQLVAVSSYSDYPPTAKKLEQVASWQGVNVERILALKPDLILAWRQGNPQLALERLAKLGMNILYLESEKIEDIAKNIEILARYSPNPDATREVSQQFTQQLTRLKQQYQHSSTPRQRVLLQFASHPLLTASAATMQSQLLELCGADNIFADSPVPWAQVNREQVLLRQPSVIVIPGDNSKIANIKQFWGKQLDIPVIAIPEDWFNRNGPRIFLAAETLCQQLASLHSPTTK